MLKNIGFAITGSFCTHKQILIEIQKLIEKGYNVLPIVSDNVYNTNTRFGTAKDFLNSLKNITKNEIIHTVVEAEPVGPKNLFDVIVVAPCTGNTLSKFANAITDNAVTMSVKSHMRNNKPVVIGVSTNDGLGMSFINIAKLLNLKNIFFIPFKQDDYLKKPKSLVADWNKLEDTILLATQYQQIQPVLI